MSDDELLHLADQKDALKDVARQALAAEPCKRRINFVAPAVAEAILGSAITSAKRSNRSFGRKPVRLENSKTNISKKSLPSLSTFSSTFVTEMCMLLFLTLKNAASFWILSFTTSSNSGRPSA